MRWKAPLVGKEAERLDSDTLTELLEEEQGLWQYFVRGAPCMLLQNIQPTKALANGSMGHMHSLTFADGTPPLLAAAEATQRYAVVELLAAPLSINIKPDLPDGDNGTGIESLAAEDVVVPILESTASLEYDTCSLFSTMANIPRTLHYRGHPLTLAFALTDFKVQGKTLGYLTLSIAARPFPPHLDLEGFYVMASRVRKGLRFC